MTGRAEKVRLAQEMRARGLLVREIADTLGVARSTAAEYLDDPDLAKAKARKARYRGACVDCGGPTDGGNGRALAPERCAKCQRVYQSTGEWRDRSQKWPASRIIDAIRWWNDTYGEPPAMTDWNPYKAEQLHDPERADLAARLIAAERVPWFNLAVTRFGSWNAAIEAAGLEPRQADGGGGNRLLQRLGHVQADILDVLYQTNGDGLRQKEIVARVEASRTTVQGALLSLRRRGYIERIGYGRYRAKAAA